MNILTLTYYKDFARYFLYLEEEASKIFADVKFYNISLYPCGRDYFHRNGFESVLLPFDLSTNSYDIEDLRRRYSINYELDDLIFYTKKALNIFRIEDIENLKVRALLYIDYFERVLISHEIEMIIVSGDTRLPIEVCIAVAKRRRIKIWYFEQGPFGTTIIDDKGVNANVSFAKRYGDPETLKDRELAEYLNEIKHFAKGNFWRNKKKNFDEILSDSKTLLSLYPPFFLKRKIPIELWIGETFSKFIINKFKSKFLLKRKKREDGLGGKPYILLLLQVPFDAQMIMHSPNYEKVSEMIDSVGANLPYGYNLIIREHPLYKGKYEKEVYDFIENNDSCTLDNLNSLNGLISLSAVVIVINSTSGLDALLMGKTVVVLGEAYYSNSLVVYEAGKKSSLNKVLNEAVNQAKEKAVINRYLKWLVGDVLIPGHYQDVNLHNAKHVFKKIFNKK